MSLPALLVVLVTAAEAVSLQVRPVPLDAGNPARERVGCLDFRGGLEIRSQDARVGGFSGLELTEHGLLTVTDRGHWLTARPQHVDGRLVGLADVRLGAIGGLDGHVLQNKGEQDAESLARLPDGRYLVGFERWHRVWAWAEGSDPEVFEAPAELVSAPNNGGAEALTVLADGDVVVVSEELRAGRGIRGWRGGRGTWQAFDVAIDDPLRPSGAATLPSGDMLLLERGYTIVRGSVVRLRRLAAADLREGAHVHGAILAELESPTTVDNFEGVAVDRGAAGGTLIYLISDDNFSATQRSLLMMFALDEARCGERAGTLGDGGSDGQL